MAQFIITKGQPKNFIIVVKQPRSTTPLDLTGSTGTFTMSSLGEDSCKVIDGKDMPIYDAVNGKFLITLTADETADLETIFMEMVKK